MGLMSKIKNEFVDIIEWIDDSRSTLAWRVPRYQNEIKNGAQLIVREGQKAIVVYRPHCPPRGAPRRSPPSIRRSPRARERRRRSADQSGRSGLGHGRCCGR